MNFGSRARLGRTVLALVGLSALLAFGSGCAAATVYQREKLTDRIMTFDAEARENARKMKAFEAREGSTGGGGGAGGGCACN